MWRPVWAIIERELTRMLRQRGRLVSAMVRPLIWLLVIGTGFQALLQGSGYASYKQFLVPGLLCMVLLFGSMLASLTLVYDKESGVMRMLIIAPFPRSWIVLARTLSAAIVGLVQAVMLMIILWPMGYMAVPDSVALFAAGLCVTALVCAAMGMLIAVFSKTLENFAVIMNFVIFPMFFLSGALYPIHHLPGALKIVALANPFSYGVDLLKHAMLSDLPQNFGADFSVGTDLAVQLGFTVAALVITVLRFSQTPVFENLARALSAPRRG